jgi:protein involved in polysaccharide export with SLBB domain
MKKLFCLGGLLACVLLSGCGGDGTSSTPSSPGPAAMSSAPPSASNIAMRVGDKITVRLSGVPDEGYFNEIQIPASGDITLPLLSQSFHAAGMNTAELADAITNAYKGQKIYTNPIVTVLPEERYVIVEGDVRSPTNIVWRPDSTLMSTINSCGGFTDYAQRSHVRLIRGTQVLYYDCTKAIQVPGADPAVLPGDQIYVLRTMF